MQYAGPEKGKKRKVWKASGNTIDPIENSDISLAAIDTYNRRKRRHAHVKDHHKTSKTSG
jgi:hypothetical protein